jgi:fructose/tagatose bisphosphate aldolase
MARSRANRFAVGAFTVDSVEMLRAVCRAASSTESPVILDLGSSGLAAIGLHNARAIVDNEVDASGVEAYLNLNHAPSVETARAAIDAGFEFVHLDLFAASRDDEDVLAATRDVVAYAARTGAIVEGDPGRFVGDPTRPHDPVDSALVRWSRSSPAAARAFVAATGVDTFAVGIGNVHGSPPCAPRVDLELLRHLRRVLAVNLSLHGGSGLSDATARAVARRGVSKVDIGTDVRVAYRDALERQLARRPDDAVAELVGAVSDAVQRVAEHKLRVLGSAGEARPPRPRS